MHLDWSDDLPPVVADPGLLERVVANLVEQRRPARAPRADLRRRPAQRTGESELRVADRGPGIPVADRDRVFAAFQRLGDSPSGQGVGLGLAVARGLTEAMGGTLTAEDTPGGGVTMVVSLPGRRRPRARTRHRSRRRPMTACS